VAEIDGRIAGFGDMINGEIKRLYVYKDYIRKKRVGTTLLKTLEETAKKMGWKKIEVNATITAVEFYKKQGYDDNGKTTHELRGLKFPVHKMSKEFQ